MNLADPTCACGKTFGLTNALSNHRRTCAVYSQQVKDLLQKAQVVWKGRKRNFAEARLAESQSTGTGSTSRRRIESTEAPPNNSSGTGIASNSSLVDASMTDIVANQSNSVPGEPVTSNPLNKPISLLNQGNEHRHPRQVTVTRSGRVVLRPAEYHDVLPTPPPAVSRAKQPVKTSQNTSEPSVQRDNNNSQPLTEGVPGAPVISSAPPESPPPHFRTKPNSLGLFCQYDRKPDPSHNPNEEITIDDLSDIPSSATQKSSNSRPSSGHATVPAHSMFYPYPNQSSFLLGEWFWTGNGSKSTADFRSLVNILSDPDFDLHDIRRTPWDAVNSMLGDSSSSEWTEWFNDACWIKESLRMEVPFHSKMGTPGPKVFDAGHFFRRSIVPVVKERLASADARHFHFEPYELFWKPNGSAEEVRVYGELYNSPAFLEAHRELQNSPPEPGCTLPRYVAALMFSSDETHLTQFGETKIWPLYLYFGNDSKYRRSRTSLDLCNHIAYFIKLPEGFKDFVVDASGGKLPTAALIAHCQRELLHTQLGLVFDPEFIDAVAHGVVVKCFDSIERRFYLRVFTHSADYKEKTMLSGIYNLGAYPCPRCLIPLVHVYRMGMKQDRKFRRTRARSDNAIYRGKLSTARNAIYKGNRAVSNKGVKGLLEKMSLAPVQNAFSDKLSESGFNLFSAMVVDLMHEVESGNWRSVFIHILRILTSVDERLVHEMDRRYRETPTFGTDTIRKFRRNCSEMKNLAARDWEDMLQASKPSQCAIPAVDGLLSGPGNTMLLDLLYVYSEWHGLAKLRIHTDWTLELLDATTQALGHQIRKFKDKTSALYHTTELKKEQAARMRRQQAGAAKRKSKKANPESAPELGDVAASIPSSRPRRKSLNLATYKFHAMGDYTETIRRLGTTDSYSTESGELEHRKPKARYSRTSRKNFTEQMTHIERRQARVRRIREKLPAAPKLSSKKPRQRAPADPMETTSLSSQYVVGRGQNEPVNLPQFIRENRGDPAITDFMAKLKAHLLPRVCKRMKLPEEFDQSRLHTFYQGDRMYRHRTIRFNYTTYDVRRAQDVVNPTKSQRNIMLLADGEKTDHPFLYCRVLGIFHVNLLCAIEGCDDTPSTQQTHRYDFLWVRWYQHARPTRKLRLDTLSFPPIDSDGAFGFVDPTNVLRACHIIPHFSKGKSVDLWTPESLTQSGLAHSEKDWEQYYIGRFSDRDVLMRYHWGLGVGHVYSHSSTTLINPAVANPQSDGESELEEEEVEEEEVEEGGVNEQGTALVQAAATSADPGVTSPPDEATSEEEDNNDDDELERDFEEKEDEDVGSASSSDEEDWSDEGSDSDAVD